MAVGKAERIDHPRNAYFALSAISLICGTAIYPLFRNSQLLVWTVLPKPGFWDIGKIPYEKGRFLSVLADNGPDCLWLLSGIFVLRGVLFFKQKIQAVYVALFYFIAAGIEAGQYFGLIPGTFDFFDLFTMSGVALAEGIIFIFSSKGEYMMKKTILHAAAIILLVGFAALGLGSMGSSPSSYSSSSSSGGSSDRAVSYYFYNMSSYTVTLYDSTGSRTISPGSNTVARFNRTIRIEDVDYSPADSVVCTYSGETFLFTDR